jgi:hypothetical protein
MRTAWMLETSSITVSFLYNAAVWELVPIDTMPVPFYWWHETMLTMATILCDLTCRVPYRVHEGSVGMFTMYQMCGLYYYWLLLGSGIVQSVPYGCDNSLSIVLPIWVRIIPDSSTRVLCSGSAETVAKRGETWREVSVNFAYQYLYHTHRVL